ncbi:predicted protein [Postia placenta Mad-698-R]|nr:predicted protein [Postia placenta Mad-698-R]
MQAESVVVLAQSFVLARLLTQRSAYWTSWHGYHRAALLSAQPFVALRVRFTEFGCDNVHLFVVSPKKRTSGLYANCDLPLVLQPGNARLDDALHAAPPLPTWTRQLYLHTFPALKTQRGIGGMLQDEESDKFKLEEPSFQRFWSKAWSETVRYREKEWGFETMKPRSSGGDEAVQDNWDTFSKDVNDVEHLHDPFGRCVFERLEFKDLPLTEEPSIYRELAIYDQLAADYSWRGVKRSIYWVEAMRNWYLLHARVYLTMQAESVVVQAQSFVLARLLPQRSAYWTSYHGYNRAALVPNRPFVALRVRYTRYECDFVQMFLVSTRKRTSGLYADCDMPLASRSDDARVGLDGALRAVPFLPTSTTSLYLHTFPGMHARDGFTVGNSVFNDDEGDKHKLDESSFERFWSKAWNEGLRFTGRGWDSKTMKPRSSGGEEPVQDKWDTFSKDVNDIEYLHNPSGRCMFERLEFQDLPLSEEPSIYRELAIYDQ